MNYYSNSIVSISQEAGFSFSDVRSMDQSDYGIVATVRMRKSDLIGRDIEHTVAKAEDVDETTRYPL